MEPDFSIEPVSTENLPRQPAFPARHLQTNALTQAGSRTICRACFSPTRSLDAELETQFRENRPPPRTRILNHSVSDRTRLSHGPFR